MIVGSKRSDGMTLTEKQYLKGVEVGFLLPLNGNYEFWAWIIIAIDRYKKPTYMDVSFDVGEWIPHGCEGTTPYKVEESLYDAIIYAMNGGTWEDDQGKDILCRLRRDGNKIPS